MLLGDQGARVTRIERPGGSVLDDQPGPIVWNRGKRSVALDLRDDADRERLLELCETADVVVENFRTGTLERLGHCGRTAADA